jgi:hypothetical protein
MEVQVDKTPDSSKKSYKLAFIIESCVLGFVLLLLSISISKNHTDMHQDTKQPSAINTQKPSQTNTIISPAQIDSWPTYIDEKDGYMIKHPSYITFDDENKSYFFMGDDERPDSADGIGPELKIRVRSGESLPTSFSDLTQVKHVIINNAKGVQQIFDGKLYAYYLVPQDGVQKLAEVNFQADYNPKFTTSLEMKRADKMYVIGRAMISTFKFVDPNTPTNTLTSTFVNKKYRYSLQYPITWGYNNSNSSVDPSVIDITEFGDPRTIGSLYVQDNLETIANPIETDGFTILVKKPTARDRETLKNNKDKYCENVIGKPYILGGQQATLFEGFCAQGAGENVIELIYEKNLYTIVTYMTPAALDPILKTFTFTD